MADKQDTWIRNKAAIQKNVFKKIDMISNTTKLKDICRKIAIESALTESEAFEIIKDGLIDPEWLDFFATKIIELSNKNEDIRIIKIKVYSLASKISLAGGLENYKSLRKQIEIFD